MYKSIFCFLSKTWLKYELYSSAPHPSQQNEFFATHEICINMLSELESVTDVAGKRLFLNRYIMF